MSKTVSENPSGRKGYIITGPTSGIGRATALELAKHGTVILVGRDPKKLDEVQKVIERKGRHAVPVVCDLSDIASVKNAAREITELDLPIAGLINSLPGRDAYATSKQCNLATVLAFARESPRLRFNAFEPGFIPNTGLGRQGNAFVRFLLQYILPLLAPHKKYWSSPQRAGREATKILINASGRTGVYYDDGGEPMLGSVQTRDPRFAERVVGETRALLSAIPT